MKYTSLVSNATVIVCHWCPWRLHLETSHTPVYASVMFDQHLDSHVTDMIRTAELPYDDNSFIPEPPF